MDILIERRKSDLLDKKPGAWIEDTYPKIVWVRMVKQPKLSNHLFTLRGKFNAILEERLTDGNAENHYIMSIEVDHNEFDLVGNLTQSGSTQFWHEVNRAMQKFDADNITLQLRKNGKSLAKFNSPKKPMKLPTPPPINEYVRAKSPTKRNKSRSRSRNRRKGDAAAVQADQDQTDIITIIMIATEVTAVNIQINVTDPGQDQDTTIQ